MTTRDETPNVYLISATRRGKNGTEVRYIMAADGSLLHRVEPDDVYHLMCASLTAGCRKVVVEILEPKGDHFERKGTMTLTPPKRERRPPSTGSEPAR